ncbi:hypothetical protein B0T20DRAFT_406588 [Sordaria brevicollis]|uniref:Uncharacterized protein n=1 Tax=Sordaria brevicollis TaxID=83679 RepID=A0AAE0PGM6_SORBR|nr:hypothetical protein B0T20DRAFT_406588 [Sordaria brevicollis]
MKTDPQYLEKRRLDMKEWRQKKQETDPQLRENYNQRRKDGRRGTKARVELLTQDLRVDGQLPEHQLAELQKLQQRDEQRKLRLREYSRRWRQMNPQSKEKYRQRRRERNRLRKQREMAEKQVQAQDEVPAQDLDCDRVSPKAAHDLPSSTKVSDSESQKHSEVAEDSFASSTLQDGTKCQDVAKDTDSNDNLASSHTLATLQGSSPSVVDESQSKDHTPTAKSLTSPMAEEVQKENRRRQKLESLHRCRQRNQWWQQVYDLNQTTADTDMGVLTCFDFDAAAAAVGGGGGGGVEEAAVPVAPVLAQTEPQLAAQNHWSYADKQTTYHNGVQQHPGQHVDQVSDKADLGSLSCFDFDAAAALAAAVAAAGGSGVEEAAVDPVLAQQQPPPPPQQTQIQPLPLEMPQPGLTGPQALSHTELHLAWDQLPPQQQPAGLELQRQQGWLESQVWQEQRREQEQRWQERWQKQQREQQRRRQQARLCYRRNRKREKQVQDQLLAQYLKDNYFPRPPADHGILEEHQVQVQQQPQQPDQIQPQPQPQSKANLTSSHNTSSIGSLTQLQLAPDQELQQQQQQARMEDPDRRLKQRQNLQQWRQKQREKDPNWRVNRRPKRMRQVVSTVQIEIPGGGDVGGGQLLADSLSLSPSWVTGTAATAETETGIQYDAGNEDDGSMSMDFLDLGLGFDMEVGLGPAGGGLGGAVCDGGGDADGCSDEVVIKVEPEAETEAEASSTVIVHPVERNRLGLQTPVTPPQVPPPRYPTTLGLQTPPPLTPIQIKVELGTPITGGSPASDSDSDSDSDSSISDGDTDSSISDSDSDSGFESDSSSTSGHSSDLSDSLSPGSTLIKVEREMELELDTSVTGVSLIKTERL